MITQIAYFAVLPTAAAFLVLLADQRWQSTGLWATALGLSVAASGLGFAAHYTAWQGSGYTEGSGMTPLTIGFLVPLTVATVIRATRTLSAPWRVVLSAITGIASVLPLAVISHYFLSGLVPYAIGCCPL